MQYETPVNIPIGRLVEGELPRFLPVGRQIRLVRFELPSFIQYVGDRVCHSQGFTRGRLEFTLASWRVVIDSVEPVAEVRRAIREDSHLVTHIGVIEKVDRSPFELAEVDEVVEDLYWLFSFVCCSRRGITRWQAFDAVGNIRFQKVEGGIKLGSPMCFSWYPLMDAGAMGRLADRFAVLRRDPFWGDVVMIATHWLSEVNDDLSLEAKITLTQTALEMMSVAILEETLNQPLPANNAPEKIRRLLNHINAPVAIAGHLIELVAEAANRQLTDGPAAIVKVRNMIAHPTRDHRANLLSLSPNTRHQASLLGRHYLVLILLWLFDYDGNHTDISNIPTVLGREVTTPWQAGGVRV